VRLARRFASEDHERVEGSAERWGDEWSDAALDPGEDREESAPRLKAGDVSVDVLHLQRLLNIQGALLVENGIFDAATDQALRAFQRLAVQQGRRLPDKPGFADQMSWMLLESFDKLDTSGPLGAFAALAPRFLDTRVARLLHELSHVFPPGEPRYRRGASPEEREEDLRALRSWLRRPRWAGDVPAIVRTAIARGHMVGIQSQARRDLIKAPLQPSAQQQLPSPAAVEGIHRAAHFPVMDQVGLQQVSRGFILFNELFLARSEPPLPRTFQQKLALAKTVNIFLNRVRDRDILPVPGLGGSAIPALDNAPLTTDNYVDPALAAERRGPQARKFFIYGVASSHVAWHVARDLKRIAQGWPATNEVRSSLPPWRAFFRAALMFAEAGMRAGGFDSGQYLASLGTDPFRFRMQIALWLGELARMDFHSAPWVNREVQLYFQTVGRVMRDPREWGRPGWPSGLA
jgi:hypothetical protein